MTNDPQDNMSNYSLRRQIEELRVKLQKVEIIVYRVGWMTWLIRHILRSFGI